MSERSSAALLGLGVTAKASNMHPSGVGHVLPLGLEPDFHPPTGGSKMGDAAGFPSPRSSAQSAAGWVRGFWPFGLMPGGPLCIHYLPGLPNNRLNGLGTRACTACRHRSVMKTVCLGYAMTLSWTPQAHYTRAPAASQHGSVS